MKQKSTPRNVRLRTKRFEQDGSEPPAHQDEKFLIAAVGASAGGVEAYTELIRDLPDDTGMAFVLIQHLDPKHHSILTELLARETRIPVEEVTDGIRIEPNRIYVIPPNASMSISDNTLQLGPRAEGPGVPMPIDHFMRSLAEAQGDCAVGIILSGSGTDGTLGMAEIQAQGGVTFAQDENSAKYDGMPRSAIGGGCVDYVLSPKEIARELTRIARHPYGSHPGPDGGGNENTAMRKVFELLRRSVGVDFTHYRQTTILRRIQRRMIVHKFEKLADYVKYIQTNPHEIKALYQDMLINVTSFFRNPRVFDAMMSAVFPALTKNRSKDLPIRIWVPGCASGEEPYSLAIALLEFLGERVHQYTIQIFGTDVSTSSVAKARSGLYPDNIQGDVSPDRLRCFFTKTDTGYRISKNIRDMCIFARHNLLSDPPFSQMDIICCRNLLIYLEPVLQNKVIALFHYATRPGGFLILGAAEGVGSCTNLFSTEDRAHRIFSKKGAALRQTVTFSLNPLREHGELGPFRIPGKPPDTAWKYVEAQKEFDRRLINQFSPATAFINADLEIVHTRGNISRYLKLAPGRASLDILKMAREGLLLDLRNALSRAKKENVTVRKQNVVIKNGNGNGTDAATHTIERNRVVNFEVVPIMIGSFKEKYFMVVFHDATTMPAAKSKRGKPVRHPASPVHRIAKLEQQLDATKEYLQSVIETQEATNEELQSANEEILSSNEELQSTNEELETAKEELQSTNEELSTVNDELRSRNIEITQINNDLTNLLASIDIAVVMVGSDLTIRRFTPRAQKQLGLIPGDVGRPLSNINLLIEIPDFQNMVLKVMSTFRPVEKDLASRGGAQLMLRILPYRTIENKIDGAVITLLPHSLRDTASSASGGDEESKM
jgi:two-component system, chemotaxis family, CheB/CheR fusion protein